MIKVGDKFIFKEKEWIVIDLNNFQDTLEAKDEDGNERYFMQSRAYKNWYEQQKQRADELEKQNDILKHNIRVELDSSRNMYIGMCEEKQRADRAEKRWEKLKEHFINEKEQSLGILSWSRNDGMLELMEQLEEDGE